MNTKQSFVLGIAVCLLVVSASGFVYASANQEGFTNNQTSVNETTTANQTNENPSSSSGESTISSDRGTVLVKGERVINASYNDDDGSLKVTFRATGPNWSANIYRADVPFTTIVPEEHTDSNGKTHPTTSHWNQNSSLPESKSYAFIGSRIDAGIKTDTRTDDEYVVTVVLPTVVQENVRFTLVEDGRAVTFFEGEY